MIRPRLVDSFQELPLEIQRMVWLCVCRIPQILPYNDRRYAGAVNPAYLVPPAVLHTCHESRQVALTVYKRVAFGGPKPIYINAEVDTIYQRLGLPHVNPVFPTLFNGAGVRSLAVGVKSFTNSSGRLQSDTLLSVIEKLPNLDEIIMVVSKNRPHSRYVIVGFAAAEECKIAFRDDIAQLQMERFLSKMEGLGIVVANSDTGHNDRSRAKEYISRPLPQIIFRSVVWGYDYRIHLPRVQDVLMPHLMLRRGGEAVSR